MSTPFPLSGLAEDLVRTRIPGMRKGLEKPAYEHSFHVQALLKQAGFSDEVCLAGLLHDIVEDSDVTLDALREMGFSPRAITLIDLCSHNPVITDGDGRWVCLMARLVEAGDVEAWSIKLADSTSNMADAFGMSPDRQRWMYAVKAPLLLKLTEPMLSTSPLWQQLKKITEESWA